MRRTLPASVLERYAERVASLGEDATRILADEEVEKQIRGAGSPTLPRREGQGSVW